MIDIHSHLVFGVDDGPATIKESIRMVLEAEKLGIKEIIVTPHYNKQLFDTDRVVENFQFLLSRVTDFDVELHLGYEIYLNPHMMENVSILKGKSLNSSEYLLFELPFGYIPEYCSKLLCGLHLEKIIPVLAHPERNRIFMRNFDSFIKFIESGCLVQIDAGSVVGAYGKEARNFARKVIRLNLAQFVASDAHCTEDYREWYPLAYNQVKQWAGEEYTDKLFFQNAKRILSGDRSRLKDG